MAVPLETFVKQLTESGVIAPGKLESFVPPKAQPKDAQELARQLVQSKQLTKFQAQEIYAGRAKSLMLGNYTLVDRIGAGGMGQVFKAHHRRMERTVAIKMLPAAMLKDAAAAARFHREVVAAAKLSHPNIVAAYDADEANGVHFLVMEYVEGQDLSALVRKDGPLSVANAVNYILQAAKGLEFAHGEGVVHRDIKPANLLLDKKKTVKILDMGLARIDAGADAATQAELTGTGAVMGTVDYMAPEQGLSTKHADARADIYSLGCSLHYLLIGKPAFDGETITAKLLAHHHDPIPDLCQLRGDAPPQVQAVFQRMVAKNVAERYQTMSAVIADLEKCSQGIVAAADSSATRASTSSDTQPGDVSISLGSKSLKPTVGAEQGKPRVKMSRPAWMGLAVGGVLAAVALIGFLFMPRSKEGAPVVEIKQTDAAALASNDTASAVEAVDEPRSEKGNAAQNSASVLTADGFTQLFNGRDLSGWTTTAAWRGNWRVENGVLTGSGAESSFLFAEKRDLADFHLRAEARVGSGVSAGIECRVPSVAEAIAADRPHVLGYGAKLNANCPADPRRTGSLYVIEPHSFQGGNSFGGSPAPPDVWCDFELLLQGDRLQIIVNKQTTTDYTDAKHLYPRGGLALQFYNGGGKVEFRKIEIKELAPSQPETRKLAYLDPAFKQWAAETQKLPAEKQIEAVSKKLMELNPGFDGRMIGPFFGGFGSPRIQNGVVTEIGFCTDNVADISPLRALAGLKALGCSGSAKDGKSGKLSDLSPLQGMPLTFLVCYLNEVSDLSPLKEAKLTYLHCGRTKVSDLSPLQGMLLTYLAVSNTKVTDLAPLKGMPLTSLWCNESPVTDLSPLQGMPLANLHCVDTRISDLLPLKDCRSLTELRCSKTKVTPATVAALKKSLPNCKIDWDDPAKAAKPKLAYLDPAFQQWVAETQKLSAQQQIEAVSKKLMELNLGFDGKLMGVEGGAKPKIKNGAVTELGLYAFDVADISPVRALSGLKSLGCYGDGPRRAKLSDLSPLAGMQLTSFYCAVTYVSDLAPLKGMPLIILYCFASPVADLSPVEGMPLVSVNITYTNISDLSPLKGAELKDIAFFGSKVTDISVLRGMPLEKVHNVAETVSDFSPFYDCKKLQSIWLKGGKFPSAQVAALQNALPNCKIVWDDPAKPQTTEPAPSGAK